MIIRNKYINKIAYHFLKHKERKFSFTYEVGIIDDEVVTQSFVRQYISELEVAVSKEIEHLTKEYKL